MLLYVTETGIVQPIPPGWRFWFDAELKPLCTQANKLVELLEKENLYISGVTPDLTTEEIRKNKEIQSGKSR